MRLQVCPGDLRFVFEEYDVCYYFSLLPLTSGIVILSYVAHPEKLRCNWDALFARRRELERENGKREI